MNNLTRDDLNIMIEAVEAWESKGLVGEMITMMAEGIGGPPPGVSVEAYREQLDRKRKARDAAAASEKKLCKEQSILLRAKLIALRDSIEADEFIARSRS